ncbi:hypothetical protein [Enterococcus asini]|uniref:hypothetical protein n=1 Tax=Enterococcus asini TaxID=57732 RepID=UPI00288E88DB|nr:hypothetical protein [Enterococcus asini]MDT2744648.1 hypothetical protein [Enterococcus asini]
MKANQDIRNSIFLNGLKNWQVAKEVGISDSRFSVWLRTPLNDERKIRVNTAIKQLISEKKESEVRT